jgi:signal transduction histidine kinase
MSTGMGQAAQFGDDYRTAMRSVPSDIAETRQAVLVGRPDGTIVHMSAAFARLTGISPDALLGRGPDAVGLITPDRLRWVLDRLPAAGRGFRYRRSVETPDGPRTLQIDVHRVTVPGDDLVMATIAPIEPDAATDMGVLGAVVDAAPLGMVVYDESLRIVRVNRAVERAGRISPAHIGMRLTEAFPAAPEVVVQGIRSVFRAGESAVNLEVEGAAGATYLITLFPIRDAAGAVVLAGCLYSDVTDRVEAERALVDSERSRRRTLAGMLRAEEDERSRIATELHDDTVQVMTASLVAMDRLALIARRRGDRELEDAVAATRATLEEATDRTRRLMFELRPAILQQRGLEAAVRVLAEQVARECGATASVRGGVRRYDRALEELVYRSVQEALANVRKHAQPGHIEVRLADEHGRLVCDVRDDGRGFDVAAARARPQAVFHLGIDSLVERVRAVGGDARVDSAPGAGTRVHVTVPYAAAA